MITTFIVIITSLVSVLAFRRKELMYRFDLSPYNLVQGSQYYRILSHAFLHTDYVHLVINMLVLWSFGTGVEQIFESLEQQGT
ncbi:MAG: rhomboid family intramembrane serine protease, partial [Bacteroidetes bacterium]